MLCIFFLFPCAAQVGNPHLRPLRALLPVRPQLGCRHELAAIPAQSALAHQNALPFQKRDEHLQHFAPGRVSMRKLPTPEFDGHIAVAVQPICKDLHGQILMHVQVQRRFVAAPQQLHLPAVGQQLFRDIGCRCLGGLLPFTRLAGLAFVAPPAPFLAGFFGHITFLRRAEESQFIIHRHASQMACGGRLLRPPPLLCRVCVFLWHWFYAEWV